MAAPLAECNKVTMICQGDAPIGAEKLTSEVLSIITQIHLTLQQIVQPKVNMKLSKKKM